MAAPLPPLDGPIRLFITDLDNTLNPYEGEALDLDLFAEIRARNLASDHDPTIPPLTLLTGRPQPYLEAMLQVVAGRLPAVFEHGFGMFHRLTDELRFHPDWTPDLAAARERLAALCHRAFVESDRAFEQLGKRGALTLIPLAPHTSASLAPEAAEIAADVSAAFAFHVGPKVLDFVPAALHKGAGVRWLIDTIGVPREQVAAMGDSTTDAQMFPEVGLSVAPANAPEDVRAQAAYVTAALTTAGVLEAYDAIIAHNRR